MEFLFDTFRDASRYTAHLARAYGSSPRLGRRGNQFAVVLPDGLKSTLGKQGLTVAAVFACLIAGQQLVGTRETELVLDAMRRSSHAMAGMSEAELSVYLGSLNPEQLQGLANNVKGIYHELAFVDAHNIEGAGSIASMFEHTNHPGADVTIAMDEDVISQIQLKATNSIDAVQAHLSAHPGIDVIATEEVAAALEGVKSSGFSNVELTEEVNEVIQSIADPTMLDAVGALVGQIASDIFESLGW